tara:strand:- start:178 stop:708 length:531 start_codon:yes stop_codon:yes gene_type:complete
MHKAIAIFFLFFLNLSISEEMIIGSEVIDPGIEFVFEAAPKDTIYPEDLHLPETETDLHIEMLANWTETNIVEAPKGGFVAYLQVKVKMVNENGQTLEVLLSPHLNLIDNLHYAKNIKLPGTLDDLYDLTFMISPPDKDVFGVHYDWFNRFGDLIKPYSVTYEDLNFKEIALKQRR